MIWSWFTATLSPLTVVCWRAACLLECDFDTRQIVRERSGSFENSVDKHRLEPEELMVPMQACWMYFLAGLEPSSHMWHPTSSLGLRAHMYDDKCIHQDGSYFLGEEDSQRQGEIIIMDKDADVEQNSSK
jgi:hypothetical protein